MDKSQLTIEQNAVIKHEGSAFISACPGAGKTRCIIERARKVLSKPNKYRGLAFLSFTNAAISELESRLTKDNLLPTPVFPHFVGTFDSFIWHYLVEPFGLSGCDNSLSVIPDTGSLIIKPFPKAQGLRLDCFDRNTGMIIPAEAKKTGFNRDPTGYETIARKLRAGLLRNGQLDFDDVRNVARINLDNDRFSKRLGCVLRTRFGEIIVDEAQDCNPDDLLIINWLRASKIPTKIVCDPHQSIYGFRGGVSDELFKYAETFPINERFRLSGNFRSTRHICKTVYMLRSPSQRGTEDKALGELKDCDLNIHILSYSGRGLSPKIGQAFLTIASKAGIDLKDCRLTAKTRSSGLKAIGAYTENVGQSLSLRLADAVMKFHYAERSQDQFFAITELHIITIIISGKLDGRTYHQFISEEKLESLAWRGQIVKILQTLCFDISKGHTRSEWIARSRRELGAFLPAGAGTIAQKLHNQNQLDDILSQIPTSCLTARTIHQVKGKQYQGMCVVLTTATAKGIIAHLEKEPDNSMAEDAREIYVAASRAQRLLVFACPKSQSARFATHISSTGAAVQLTEI
ncbi:MAG: DNA helicase [SAR86 cluster bacterium]|uniref:DNA helicase n=1 Tax=SAR86 cluster bacterium TaxID=2030880 RepID=A0A2A5CIP5_9GAMM|nr:MAG: DNA helicase [SAR86 cluster bacterium]